MSDIDVNQLLQQMRTMASMAKSTPESLPAQGVGKADFGALLKSSIESVNDASVHASQLAESFEKGEPNVDLAQVMVSLQKASLSFEAMTQVRNKLLSAYQEIMSMPV